MSKFFLSKRFMMSKRFLITILVVLFLFFFFGGTFRTYLVLGGSDAPTFLSGDKVIINRSTFDLTIPFTSFRLLSWGKPERGDMVLCRLPRNGDEDYWLKRIMGIPGDTIQIIRNKIYINNKSLKYEVLKKESFNIEGKTVTGDLYALESGQGLNHTVAYSEKSGFLSDFGPIIVRQNHYFVLGDNRDNSLDSRIYGLVKRDNIFGKYVFTLSRI
ncbi:MAG: signal peptidase I [Bacteroidales bacterium]|nr:signal peptidase I [Bacteroidales bacterium]